LNAIKIPRLGAAEQGIGEILGALDDKIELNRRMNETLEAMAQAIFRDWFVDFGPTRRKLAGLTDPVEIMGGLVQDPGRAAEVAALFPAALGDSGLPEGWSEQSIYEPADVAYGAPFASEYFNTRSRPPDGAD
jgi:type I restriction enzyme S subunit